MKKFRKIWLLPPAALLAGYWAYHASRPQPLEVETARATEGPLEVAVEEEGRLRVRDRFVLAAPVEGRLARISLKPGDPVRAGDEAALLTPSPLDPRSAASAPARLASAAALVREADDRLRKAQTELALKVRERERIEKLTASGDLPQHRLDEARAAEASSQRDADAARNRLDAARYDAEALRASLSAAPADAAPPQPIAVRSPVNGRVLEVHEPSERTVPAGAPLLTVADTSACEAVIEVLTADAVNIRPGAPVLLREWGGAEPLRATVRRVEPQAFVKVSALGVEERRVRVLANVALSPGQSALLGDGYKVEAAITVWSTPKTLKVPAAAVFRSGRSWASFRVSNGLLELVLLETGRRNPEEVEVLSGLSPGDEVVLRPAREFHSGLAVRSKPAPE